MRGVRFIDHRGKQVLLIDYTDGTAEEVLQILGEVEEVIAAQPPDSVLTLSDFTGVTLDKAAADRMKIVATKDRPHVRRAAFVGGENIPDVFYRALLSFSVRQFPNFKTREEALEYLVREEEEAAAS